MHTHAPSSTHEMHACALTCTHSLPWLPWAPGPPPRSPHTPHSHMQTCTAPHPGHTHTGVHGWVYTHQGHSCNLAHPWSHSKTHQGTQEETQPQPLTRAVTPWQGALGSEAAVQTQDGHHQGHPGPWGREGRCFLSRGEGSRSPGETRAGDRPDLAGSAGPCNPDDP